MLQFQTLDDILDFAIVQERAAQKFYTKLSGQADDLNMQLFYRTLAEEEQTHEKKTAKAQEQQFRTARPGLDRPAKKRLSGCFAHRSRHEY